ncbi:hypothetical protein TNCV_71331 [Trichonephila clavipes]|nr:hypothetical protein TNCV_71331 [Trichonephila clavipes]
MMLGMTKVVFSILLSGMMAIGRTMESGIIQCRRVVHFKYVKAQVVKDSYSHSSTNSSFLLRHLGRQCRQKLSVLANAGFSHPEPPCIAPLLPPLDISNSVNAITKEINSCKSELSH